MIDELEVLKMVIQRLNLSHILYMVTGSVGSNFYTIPRMTRDIDIVIEIKEDDAEKICSVFEDDFYIDKKLVMNAIQHEKMFNIIHNKAIVKIDFIVKKNTVYRKVEFERRRPVLFEDTNIYIASPEDIFISKLFWAKDSMSQLQINDARNLLSTVPDLDMEYIEKWIKNLSLEHIYKETKGERYISGNGNCLS